MKKSKLLTKEVLRKRFKFVEYFDDRDITKYQKQGSDYILEESKETGYFLIGYKKPYYRTMGTPFCYTWELENRLKALDK